MTVQHPGRTQPAVLVRDGSEVTAADSARVGGKATGLARLAGTGAAVPAWLVIDAEGFTTHLGRGELPARRRELLAATDTASRERAAERLRAAIVGTPVSTELAQAVARALKGRGAVAVRSSAVGEDGADRSYAGIYESHLYVTGTADVLDAVRRCWASAFSPRALDYRDGSAGAGTIPEVAVIIQEMVAGEVSGVLFTADPVTGSADRAVISACWGMGEGIVSGECATDEFTVAHDGTEISARIADKDIEFVRGEDGHGVRARAIEPQRRTVRCLSPRQVAALTHEGVRVATALGAPQDIEWTLREGVPVLLQTRPIT
ncbi:MAG: pyruvate, water dikinase, partial [Nocardia sp.]|nr:pyruvate, water dikinase [Nocardia sp.]